MFIRYEYRNYLASWTNRDVFGFIVEINTTDNLMTYKKCQGVRDFLDDDILNIVGLASSRKYVKILQKSICQELEDYVVPNIALAFSITENFKQPLTDYDYSREIRAEDMRVSIPSNGIEIFFSKQINTSFINNITEQAMYVFEEFLSNILIKEHIEFKLNKLVVNGEHITP